VAIATPAMPANNRRRNRFTMTYPFPLAGLAYRLRTPLHHKSCGQEENSKFKIQNSKPTL
jgi:hypothetical protein